MKRILVCSPLQRQLYPWPPHNACRKWPARRSAASVTNRVCRDKSSRGSSAYSNWLIDHPGANAEEWLRELYPMRNDPLQEMVQGTTWSKALRFAPARLIDLPRGRNSHYYFGICAAKCHPIHQRFWRCIIACTGGLGASYGARFGKKTGMRGWQRLSKRQLGFTFFFRRARPHHP
jgi:hypothetical protein